ncbi:hypothetical protein A1O3_03573 [Capronia epimyces CBS 606.96]|uniref:Laccase n=1 Tax=Capronia epimyces CBS 606.96 TaxID=1182542 RepID=W9YAE1_9EURO|nr:uncharacterized protein A1O3_03573 [Capronia epimyces CBS 606.96]EXJ86620.1 hypothetical protein A1O3_03573 [Capronia epimyces CBS 606.96]
MKAGFSLALLGSVLAGGAHAMLEKWMGGGDCPWPGPTVTGSHPQKDMPDTAGVTRYYNFTLSRATLAPDGVQVPVIVVNGQYPGPLIEANWGDWIEVNVQNEIWGPEDLTTVHWHGLNQAGTPYFDGVSTVSHCPIVPGSNLTYRFRADEYGTSWYHSHYSAQYSAGAHGPIVIHGPNEVDYDVDLGPIIVSDWFHDTYEHLVELVLSPTSTGLPFRPFSDSNLVGGAGQYPCANITNGTPCSVVPFASYEFQPGKTHRLRFVNTGTSAFETISIDGHTMTVIANDFVPVQPYDTEFVTIGVGQRVDVLVTASAASGSYWLRAHNSPGCGDTNGPDGRAVIYYSGVDSSIVPTSTGTAPPANPVCANAALSGTVPAYAIPAAEADTTITLTIAGATNGTGVFHWTMNGVSYSGDLDTPLLFSGIQTQDQASSLPAERQIYNTGTNGTVRIVVINTTPAPHPMHLHGHDFQVLAEGAGTWDGTITNPSNPQRRDVHILWAGATATNPTYIVLQYAQDNPGVWPLHCHIAWHLSAGMGIMLLERPDELAQVQIPTDVADTCVLFQQWQTTNPTTEVDDGLKKRQVEVAAHRMIEHMKHRPGSGSGSGSGTDREHARHLDSHMKRSVHGWGKAMRRGREGEAIASMDISRPRSTTLAAGSFPGEVGHGPEGEG